MFDGNFKSFDQDTSIQSHLLYKPALKGAFRWKYATDTDWGLNRRIDQEFKTSNHKWESSYLFKNLMHQNIVSYKKSDYDSSISSADKILTNSGSVGQLLRYSITDSLYIEGKIEYFYTKEEHTSTDRQYVSNGPGNNLNLRYSTDIADGTFALVSTYDDKYTDRKKYKRFNTNLDWRYIGETRYLKTDMNYNLNREKIMATSNTDETFVVADEQSVDNINFNIYYDELFWDRYNVSLTNNFYSSSYEVENSVLKNSNDWTNESSLYLSIPMNTITFNSELHYTYFDKSFDEGSGDRKEETRRALGGFSYNFLDADTLEVSFSRQLFRREYPNATDDADKDNVTDFLNTKLMLFPYKNVYTEFSFGWHKHDEIYIKGSYSGNNYEKTDYDFRPLVKILLHDNVVFRQNYQIYASYKDYVYSEEGSFTDRFYRKIMAEYALTWDNRPLVTQEFVFKEFGQGFALRRDYFHTEIRYKYLTSEDASKVDEVYLITVRNEDHSLEWDFSKYFNKWNTSFTPIYEWGDDEKLEFDIRTSYYFDFNSSVMVRVNPEFEEGRDSIWEISAEIKYSF